jgi:hypothetical protein
MGGFETLKLEKEPKLKPPSFIGIKGFFVFFEIIYG